MHTSHMALSDFVQVFTLIVFLMRSPNLAEIFPAQKSLCYSLPEGDSVADAELTCPMVSLTQQRGWLTASRVAGVLLRSPCMKWDLLT